MFVVLYLFHKTFHRLPYVSIPVSHSSSASSSALSDGTFWDVGKVVDLSSSTQNVAGVIEKLHLKCHFVII